jgi:hypothetical protein
LKRLAHSGAVFLFLYLFSYGWRPGISQAQNSSAAPGCAHARHWFFMGVFIATYQVTADSIFLNRLGQYLDKAFLAAGILGIISTALFSYFQSVIRFSILTQSKRWDHSSVYRCRVPAPALW